MTLVCVSCTHIKKPIADVKDGLEKPIERRSMKHTHAATACLMEHSHNHYYTDVSHVHHPYGPCRVKQRHMNGSGMGYIKTYDDLGRLKTFPFDNATRTFNDEALGNITGWDYTN